MWYCEGNKKCMIRINGFKNWSVLYDVKDKICLCNILYIFVRIVPSFITAVANWHCALCKKMIGACYWHKANRGHCIRKYSLIYIFTYGETENPPCAWQRTWRSRCRRCWSWSRSELNKSFVWSSVFIILVVDTFRLFIEETEPQRTWKFVSSQMVRPSDVDGTLYSVGHGGWQQTCKRCIAMTYLLLFI